MKANDILNNTQLMTKILGGVFSILGLILLGINYSHDDNVINLNEDEYSVTEEPAENV